MAQTLIDMGGPSGLPIDVLLSSLPSLPRPVLERLVQRAIDHMDDYDGEPDEEDGEAEDCFQLSPMCLARASMDGPGCNVSDPDFAVDDLGCDEDTDLEPDNDYEPGWLPAESDGQVPVRDLHSD